MCNIRFIALTLVWTVNFTLSLSLNASEISTISEVSVFKSTDWVRVWNRKANSQINHNKIILRPSPQGHRLKIKSAHYSTHFLLFQHVCAVRRVLKRVLNKQKRYFRELIKNSAFSAVLSLINSPSWLAPWAPLVEPPRHVIELGDKDPSPYPI